MLIHLSILCRTGYHERLLLHQVGRLLFMLICMNTSCY